MSDLIVAFFPSSRSTSKRTVQFSTTSQLKFVERTDATTDASTLWYKNKDYREMRVETTKAVLQARLAFTSVKSESKEVNEMDEVTLTGIENILTSGIIKKTKACRVQHINAVLEEQKSQACAGVYDADRLSSVSRHHSKSSAKRARTIGMFQSRR